MVFSRSYMVPLALALILLFVSGVFNLWDINSSMVMYITALVIYAIQINLPLPGFAEKGEYIVEIGSINTTLYKEGRDDLPIDDISLTHSDPPILCVALSPNAKGKFVISGSIYQGNKSEKFRANFCAVEKAEPKKTTETAEEETGVALVYRQAGHFCANSGDEPCIVAEVRFPKDFKKCDYNSNHIRFTVG